MATTSFTKKFTISKKDSKEFIKIFNSEPKDLKIEKSQFIKVSDNPKLLNLFRK